MSDAYHDELRKAEGRSSLTITSIVDVLREMREADARLEALEVLARAHVGSALLLRHHLSSHAAHLENLPSSRRAAPRGVVRTAVSLRRCVDDAAQEAVALADHAGLDGSPSVELDGFDDDEPLAAVPHHLSHVLLELLKNSFKAHLDARKADVPVLVRRRVDASAIAIDVADFGPGVPGGAPAFQSLASLRPGKRYDRLDRQTSYAAVEDPLAGFGVGLFLARIHAECFEGNRLLLASDPTGATATLLLSGGIDAPERDYE
mmetsp:Transcript_12011/g.38246  ORF Transcript_12011/g.38246 Transcript_12011/m.38246 type:complete len:262 (+) Transcript_12011:334-1119(+)